MTTNLEKQFFDTFGIEPETEIYWCDNDNKLCECEYDCDELCRNKKIGYPQITDRILLELICIFRQHQEMCYFTSVQELKKTLLTDFIEYYDRKINARTYTWLIEDAKQIKHQVQALFEEER